MRNWVAPPPPSDLAAGPLPTFSVVIAAYQSASFIAEAVESALAQTLRAHEVIVCDDGSTDDLEAAIESYRPPVIFIRKEHGGVASARNVAARSATGDFIVILDADDAFFPHHLEALGELATARPDLDILVADAFLELGGRDIARCYRGPNEFLADKQRHGILQRNFILHGAVRRSRLLEIGGFDESLPLSEDWDCWITLILAGAAAGLVDEPLARYRLREGSLTSDHSRDLDARVRALGKAFSHPALRPEDRPVLEQSFRLHRRRAVSAKAESELRGNRSGARHRLLELALQRDLALGMRTKLGSRCASSRARSQCARAPDAEDRAIVARAVRAVWVRGNCSRTEQGARPPHEFVFTPVEYDVAREPKARRPGGYASGVAAAGKPVATSLHG